jgi:tetratricopeptide (TPR) repeat protein
MPLNWVSNKKADDVPGLIARGKYEKALEMLEDQLRQEPTSVHLRQSLADTMVMAGRKDDAVQILLRLSDDFARDGFAAKAIAILKKIDRFAPGRTDVYRKLATELPKKEEQQEWQRNSVRTVTREQKAPEPTPEEHATDRAVFEDYFSRENEWSSQQMLLDAEEGLTKAPKNLTTPLFESFTSDELLPLIRGLRLVTYEPGDIVVAEGEPGDGLFILTSGRVKAYVRDAVGHFGKIRELTDGDFFGEISFLQSKPRTATIAAASRCEMLILDNSALVEICKIHPHVRGVLERFSAQRENSPVEVTVRKSGGSESQDI